MEDTGVDLRAVLTRTNKSMMRSKMHPRALAIIGCCMQGKSTMTAHLRGSNLTATRDPDADSDEEDPAWFFSHDQEDLRIQGATNLG